ncbi:MAG: CoB--CoM heterodisulfide reductase iron-sulfur subunit B family protein [Planctomycetia bacterium]|nr:CoB--CoM heterodisulfide reductase iron-sulfur subunit B family protein [Planctomycetia bacterium]
MKFGYYPGCALHGSSLDYESSIRACLTKLNVSLEELNDWICCGSTAAHSINQKLSTALPARNLAIAESMSLTEVFAPCPLCSMQLIKARESIKASDAVRKEISEIVELPVSGTTDIINLIQIFQRIGFDKILARQTKKLDAFKPACYYGCLLTRPPKMLKFDDCEHPSSMETLLAKLSAQPVDWNYKTECCGAGLTLCDAESVVELSNRIIGNAVKHGANCLVVACQMCQMNLDMRQQDIEKKLKIQYNIPIYYLSDLVGLAIGIDAKELNLDRHFVPANLE